MAHNLEHSVVHAERTENADENSVKYALNLNKSFLFRLLCPYNIC